MPQQAGIVPHLVQGIAHPGAIGAPGQVDGPGQDAGQIVGMGQADRGRDAAGVRDAETAPRGSQNLAGDGPVVIEEGVGLHHRQIDLGQIGPRQGGKGAAGNPPVAEQRQSVGRR